jgi:hypothetical protein
MNPRRRHDRGEFLDELERLEHDVGGAVTPLAL